MSATHRKTDNHLFSVELKTKDHVRRLDLGTTEDATVLIEGFLGKLESLSFTEGLMLEINGANGTLRMDLEVAELERLLPTNVQKKVAKGVNEK